MATGNTTNNNGARPRGRQRLGVYRIQCMVPQAALDELKRREQAGHGYRTRIAATILCDELIGGVTPKGGSLHQI
jgi:hypothetical protein